MVLITLAADDSLHGPRVEGALEGRDYERGVTARGETPPSMQSDDLIFCNKRWSFSIS